MSRRAIVCLTLALVLMGASAAARGESIAVVQVRVQSSPPLDRGHLVALVSGMRQPSSAAGTRFILDWPTSGSSPPGSPAAKSIRQAEAAYQTASELDWNGRYREVLGVVEPAIEAVRRNAAEVAAAPSSRELLFQLELLRVKAYWRQQRLDRAGQHMAEVIRSYPDHAVSRSLHGPGFLARSQSILAEVSRKKAPLRIVTRRAGANVFVDERFVGRSPLITPPLVAGTYRIFAQDGPEDSRVHEVLVGGDADAVAMLDVQVDAALNRGGTQSGSIVELVFPSRGDLTARLETSVRAIGRELRCDRVVAVVSAPTELGDPGPARRLLSFGGSDGAIGHSGELPAAPTVAELVALGRSFEDGAPAEGHAWIPSDHTSHESAPQPLASDGPRAPQRLRVLRGIAWGALAIGVGALAGGIGALAWDGVGPSSRPCASGGVGGCPKGARDTAAWGGGLAGVGGALALSSTVLLLATERPRLLRTTALIAVVWGVGAIALGAISYPAQDGYVGRTTQDAMNDTVVHAPNTQTPALVSIGAGAASFMTGVSLLIANRLHHHDDRRSSSLRLAPAIGSTVGLALSGVL